MSSKFVDCYLYHYTALDDNINIRDYIFFVLEREMESRRDGLMKLAIFDFDGTLFTKDLIPFLMKEWNKLGYPKRKTRRVFLKVLVQYIFYKVGRPSLEEKDRLRTLAYVEFCSLFDGMNKGDLELFFRLTSVSVKGYLRESIVNEVIRLKNEGYYTVLISGAFIDLLLMSVEDLPFDKVFGSNIYFDEEGYFDLSKRELEIKGPTKIDVISEFFSYDDIDYDS